MERKMEEFAVFGERIVRSAAGDLKTCGQATAGSWQIALMPGPVSGFDDACEPDLQSTVSQRKRKGRGRARKGKLGRTGNQDRVRAEAETLENGFCSVVANDLMADGSDGASEEIRKVDGVLDAEARDLDGVASSGTAGTGQCGDEAVDLEPNSFSWSKLEKNGGDVDAHGNGDAPLKDVEHTPAETSRKRRKLSAKVEVTPETPLRRSARRLAAATAISDPFIDFASKSIKKEKRSLEKKPSIEIKDSILILPPSSKDLALEELQVVDVFSVYSFLRSFSTVLFLSPFSLKAFVAALKCTIANSLTDAIHYSILQALKPHLEALSEEGSEFASNCLRNLNWELLDTTNWPLYVAEYFLINNPRLCSGLKLLHGEYYDQPAASKLEILQHLCDDVVEVEKIRNEINKRMLEFDNNVDNGQNPNFTVEMSDGNSDWCCLCGMDGSLICCDGCPAAFHSRCVGMAGDLLPEGEWFCPECMVRNLDGNMKILRSFEGAEVLGFDHCSRIYFASCGYLLVSEPSDSNPLYHYYNSNDVQDVIKLLMSSCSSHAHLTSSITRHWGIDQISAHPMAFKSISPVEGLNITEKEHHVDSSFGGLIVSRIAKGSKISLLIQEKTEDTCSAGNTLHGPMQETKYEYSNLDDNSKEALPALLQELHDYVNLYSFGRFTSSVAELMNKSPMDITKKCILSADDIISYQLRAIYKKSSNQYWSSVQRLPANAQKEVCGWCFACRNCNEQECLLRVIETKILSGSRSRTLNFHPKDSKKSHIFSLVHFILQIEDSLHGLLSGPWHNPYHKKRWRRNILKAADVTSLKYPLLTLEFHLRRVALSSDWMKPLDSTLMVGSGSHVLPRPVPVYPRQGGGKKTRKNSSESKSIPDLGFYSLSSFRSKSDAYWWRGGKLSRQVFNWNMLPRSLALKGGRQAGCKRIPGIIYLEGSEFARRSKCIAWRAAVEMSHNVAQLMYQIKDLDSNIRWNDLLISHPLPKLGKDYRKSLKPTWKAAICQKHEKEGHLRYLLHFGKKKSIPDVVTKHGVLQEGTSNEDKKYWLDESYIPVSLLKSYEAKKLDKKLKKTNLEGVLDKGKCDVRKPNKKKGLSYLLSRARDSDQFLCRHCGKLVRQREEAVNCQICEGTIHKKHFRLPKGAISTIYICLRCHKNKAAANTKDLRLPGIKKSNAKKILKKYKKISHDRISISAVDGSSKRYSIRCASEKKDEKGLAVEFRERKHVSRPKRRGRKAVKCKILAVRKSERLAKKKKNKKLSKKIRKKKSGLNKLQKGVAQRVVAPKILRKVIEWHKGQRTSIQPPFWLNGLMWTRKAFDDGAIHFQEKSILLPSPNLDTNIKPVCGLCYQDYDSCLIYIGCEYCGDWFHGDAFALNLGNINNVRGFKCHKCRTQSMPLCPYLNGADKPFGTSGNISIL